MENSSCKVYQFRIRLIGVSPMVWRRIHVKDSTSISELHYILQALMEWDDIHLNQFKIRGKSYGVFHNGGINFDDDPDKVPLNSFNFRINEKFIYEYNFTDDWEIEIRLEKMLPEQTEASYPKCTAGSRIAPPEEIGGAWAYMAAKDNFPSWQAEKKFVKYLLKWRNGKITFEGVKAKLETLKYYFDGNLFKAANATQNMQKYLLERMAG